MTLAIRAPLRRIDRAPSIPAAAVAGVLATYGMDVAGGRIARALRMKPPSGLGRWIGYMLRGRLTHEDITEAPPLAHEAALGMTAHYAIGLVLGAGYALLLRVPDAGGNSVARATGYGVATTAFPWFLMFPARGQGVMGLRNHDLRVPAFALCTHIAYGVGLGVGVEVADSLLERRRRWVLA